MSWDAIRGHSLIIRQLQAAYAGGRLGQAYLFAGPRGIGKMALAHEFARALLCERPRTPLATCDSCAACDLTRADTHPDLILKGRRGDALDLKLDVMREFTGEIQLRAARGIRKVAILDDAEAMNTEATNTFLKTLEEPPPGCVILLVVAGSSDSVLPTILSRCQNVTFAPLRPADLDAVLTGRGVEDPAERKRLAKLSGGSPGVALGLRDAELWEFRSRLFGMVAAEKVDFAGTLEAWNAFIAGGGKESLAKRGRALQIQRFLIELHEMALRAALGDELADADPSERKAAFALGQRLGSEGIMARIDRIMQADAYVEGGVLIDLSIESLLDALSR